MERRLTTRHRARTTVYLLLPGRKRRLCRARNLSASGVFVETSDLGLFAEHDWQLGAVVLTGGVRADRAWVLPLLRDNAQFTETPLSFFLDSVLPMIRVEDITRLMREGGPRTADSTDGPRPADPLGRTDGA